MIYRLKELQGDTIAVPQLVFSKLGIAEEYNVRVALYVLATGITDPDKICADLKLRSRISAESALSFWAGAGLLGRYEERAAPGAAPSAPAPRAWAEVAAARRGVRFVPLQQASACPEGEGALGADAAAQLEVGTDLVRVGDAGRQHIQSHAHIVFFGDAQFGKHQLRHCNGIALEFF